MTVYRIPPSVLIDGETYYFEEENQEGVFRYKLKSNIDLHENEMSPDIYLDRNGEICR